MKTYKINDVTLSETELRKLIKENPELKEEKVGRWKPECDEKYWFISDEGFILNCGWFDTYMDLFRWQSKNCFKTEEEAQKALKRQEAINTVTLAIEEANEGWVPDWENSNELKYFLVYPHNCKEFGVSNVISIQYIPIVSYIKSEKLAYQIIKDYEEELKIIFEIE